MNAEDILGGAFVVITIGLYLVGTSFNKARVWTPKKSDVVCRIGVLIAAIGTVLFVIVGVLYVVTRFMSSIV